LHDRVALPELDIPYGLRFPHVRPEGTLALRVTVPAKPLSAVRVMTDDPEDPRGIFAGELALIVKSWKLKVVVAVRLREPLVPVTASEYAPFVAELHETTTRPELVTGLGVRPEQVKPEGTLSLRVTVPAKPPNAITLTVELLVSPTSALVGEDSETLKSETD
jgi:hypothetical protein